MRFSGVHVDVRTAKTTDALSIVDEAIARAGDGHHRVWAVFDTEGEDTARAEERVREFNGTARDVSVDTAVSHPDFEVWLLLHYRTAAEVRECCTTGDAAKTLEKALAHWQKGGWNAQRRRGTRYEDFAANVQDACRRADELGEVSRGALPATGVGAVIRAEEGRFPHARVTCGRACRRIGRGGGPIAWRRAWTAPRGPTRRGAHGGRGPRRGCGGPRGGCGGRLRPGPRVGTRAPVRRRS
ncbi:RloB family protein [Streptomonospora salina]|uniref:RloB family protein n=1 Tax=Streptomonospora salina TaxID=104205 RepID=UPI003CD05991